MNNLSQILIGVLGRTTGIFLANGFAILNWIGRLLTGKIAKIVTYDKGQLTDGLTYSPGSKIKSYWMFIPKMNIISTNISQAIEGFRLVLLHSPSGSLD